MSSPLVHSVHFYDRDEALIARLNHVVASSLEGGGSVLIVATEEHRAQLAAAIEQSGSEIKKLALSRMQMFDAKETLAKFMVKGHPSDTRFWASVGKLLTNAGAAAKVEQGGLTVSAKW